MTRHRPILVGLLTISMVTAGCFYVPQGDEVSISIYGFEDSNESSIALNPISISDSGFTVDGSLSASGGAPDREIYRDLSLRLYSKDGQLVCVARLGDWTVTQQKNVSVSTTRVPQYAVLYSPDFWNEPMTVEYFTYDEANQEFRPHEAARPDELPVQVSDQQAESC